MRKKFIVSIHGLTEEQENKFVEFCTQLGMGWWHYIDNFWLLVTYGGKISALEIRKKLDTISGNKRCLVIEVTGNMKYAGRGPKEEGNNMFDWLNSEWKGG